MNNKTAMQELIEFTTYLSSKHPISDILSMAHRLLAEEKKQISNAWSDGLNTERRGIHPHYSGDDYFGETFTTNSESPPKNI